MGLSVSSHQIVVWSYEDIRGIRRFMLLIGGYLGTSSIFLAVGIIEEKAAPLEAMKLSWSNEAREKRLSERTFFFYSPFIPKRFLNNLSGDLVVFLSVKN